jgi:hypothetical protein
MKINDSSHTVNPMIKLFNFIEQILLCYKLNKGKRIKQTFVGFGLMFQIRSIHHQPFIQDR